MDTDREDTATYRGAEYHLPDGTIEVVFETTDDRVLTVREYPTRESFTDAIATADFAGENEAVSTLPDVEAFAEQSASSDDDDGPI